MEVGGGGEWGGEKGFERFGELCEMKAMVEGIPMNGYRLYVSITHPCSFRCTSSVNNWSWVVSQILHVCFFPNYVVKLSNWHLLSITYTYMIHLDYT